MIRDVVDSPARWQDALARQPKTCPSCGSDDLAPSFEAGHPGWDCLACLAEFGEML